MKTRFIWFADYGRPALSSCTRFILAGYLPTSAELGRSRLQAMPGGGLKWTRTTDLALIRRAL